MVALGVLSGMPSHAGDAEPTSSTSPSAAKRSNSNCGIEQADEKWEMKHLRLRIVKSDEKVFCIDDSFESAMNLLEQIIEIGGFVQRVNNVRENHALGFHALEFRDVLIAEQDTANIGVVEAIYSDDIEPAQLAGFCAKAAVEIRSGALLHRQQSKLFADGSSFGRRMQPGKRFTDQIFRGVTENAGESFVDKKKVAVRGHDRQQLAGDREKGLGLLRGKFRHALGHQTLWHCP